MKPTFTEGLAATGAPEETLVPSSPDGSFFYRFVDGLYSLLGLERFFVVADAAWVVRAPGADTVERLERLHERLATSRPLGALQRSGLLRVAALRSARGAATLLFHERAASVVFLRRSGDDFYASLYSYVRVTPGLLLFVVVALLGLVSGRLDLPGVGLAESYGELAGIVEAIVRFVVALVVLGALRLWLTRPELADVDDARMIGVAARRAIEGLLGDGGEGARADAAGERPRSHELPELLGARMRGFPWIPSWRRVKVEAGRPGPA